MSECAEVIVGDYGMTYVEGGWQEAGLARARQGRVGSSDK